MIAAHAAIIAYGVRATTGSPDPDGPVVVEPIVYLPQPERPGATGLAPVVQAPGPIVAPLPVPPAFTVSIPGGRTEPWVPVVSPEPLGGPLTGDPNGVFDPRVVEQQPELLSSPPPRYPEMLRMAHVEGVVIVQGVVDTVGHLERNTLKVISSPHPALSTSAIECLEGAVFRPGRVEGRAVRVLIQVPVRFSIAERRGGF